MAQGAVKMKTSHTSKASHLKSAITKKGARTIAPKKATLMKQQKMTKRFSAGLTEKTEKMLGAKVGHLEMLGGGKKWKCGDKKGEGEQKKQKRKG